MLTPEPYQCRAHMAGQQVRACEDGQRVVEIQLADYVGHGVSIAVDEVDVAAVEGSCDGARSDETNSTLRPDDGCLLRVVFIAESDRIAHGVDVVTDVENAAGLGVDNQEVRSIPCG